MFLYELISLNMPFEGMEQIKEYILDGGRPRLTLRVIFRFFLSLLWVRMHSHIILPPKDFGFLFFLIFVCFVLSSQVRDFGNRIWIQF